MAGIDIMDFILINQIFCVYYDESSSPCADDFINDADYPIQGFFLSVNMNTPQAPDAAKRQSSRNSERFSKKSALDKVEKSTDRARGLRSSANYTVNCL